MGLVLSDEAFNSLLMRFELRRETGLPTFLYAFNSLLMRFSWTNTSRLEFTGAFNSLLMRFTRTGRSRYSTKALEDFQFSPHEIRGEEVNSLNGAHLSTFNSLLMRFKR